MAPKGIGRGVVSPIRYVEVVRLPRARRVRDTGAMEIAPSGPPSETQESLASAAESAIQTAEPPKAYDGKAPLMIDRTLPWSFLALSPSESASETEESDASVAETSMLIAEPPMEYDGEDPIRPPDGAGADRPTRLTPRTPAPSRLQHTNAMLVKDTPKAQQCVHHVL